jgi:hypothetical protein
MSSQESKVYRLQGIPGHLDRLGVAQLISTFLPTGRLQDVTVASLAPHCGFWDRSFTKVATLCLRELPEAVRAAPTAGEWLLQVSTLPKPLLLDNKFHGLTPLNDISESQHKYE